MFSSFGLFVLFVLSFVSSIISFTLESKELWATNYPTARFQYGGKFPVWTGFCKLSFLKELNLVQFVCFLSIISSAILNGSPFIFMYVYLSLLTVLLSIE